MFDSKNFNIDIFYLILIELTELIGNIYTEAYKHITNNNSSDLWFLKGWIQFKELFPKFYWEVMKYLFSCVLVGKWSVY